MVHLHAARREMQSEMQRDAERCRERCREMQSEMQREMQRGRQMKDDRCPSKPIKDRVSPIQNEPDDKSTPPKVRDLDYFCCGHAALFSKSLALRLSLFF